MLNKEYKNKNKNAKKKQKEAVSQQFRKWFDNFMKKHEDMLKELAKR